jgi:hypothetical protein
VRDAEIDLHRHLQTAVRDADGRDLHVLAHDDRAGTFVDDDAGAAIGHDVERLDAGEQRDDLLVTRLWLEPHLDRCRIERARRGSPEEVVHHSRHAHRRREIGLVQAEAHGPVGTEIDRHLAFDDGPARDHARRGVTARGR